MHGWKSHHLIKKAQHGVIVHHKLPSRTGIEGLSIEYKICTQTKRLTRYNWQAFFIQFQSHVIQVGIVMKYINRLRI
jgi:hypothetical protein